MKVTLSRHFADSSKKYITIKEIVVIKIHFIEHFINFYYFYQIREYQKDCKKYFFHEKTFFFNLSLTHTFAYIYVCTLSSDRC